MSDLFCSVMISTRQCRTLIEADTERAAADAMEAMLRQQRLPDTSMAISIQCRDAEAGKRLGFYVTDLASELEWSEDQA